MMCWWLQAVFWKQNAAFKVWSCSPVLIIALSGCRASFCCKKSGFWMLERTCCPDKVNGNFPIRTSKNRFCPEHLLLVVSLSKNALLCLGDLLDTMPKAPGDTKWQYFKPSIATAPCWYALNSVVSSNQLQLPLILCLGYVKKHVPMAWKRFTIDSDKLM